VIVGERAARRPLPRFRRPPHGRVSGRALPPALAEHYSVSRVTVACGTGGPRAARDVSGDAAARVSGCTPVLPAAVTVRRYACWERVRMHPDAPGCTSGAVSSSPPSDTQAREISPKPGITRTRSPAACWAAPASPRGEAAMTAPTIAPLIPPRTRPGAHRRGAAERHPALSNRAQALLGAAWRSVPLPMGRLLRPQPFT
jgi:hypothetical protein